MTNSSHETSGETKTHRVGKYRLLKLIVATGGIAALVFVIIVPSYFMRGHSRRLTESLVNARTVTLVEFAEPFRNGELVFHRTTATPVQIDAIRSATRGWIQPLTQSAMCFTPHHRIEVTRSDGTLLPLEICFQCDNFTIDGVGPIPLPNGWRARFAALFESAGMSPAKDYRKLAMEHPDYLRLKSKANSLIDP